MSVLIRGMEMPKNCKQCFYRGSGCRSNKHNNGRPQDCLLIEIPPHGDLIDADKLVELCDIMANECVNKCDGIGATIWHQFKATVEWSPVVIPEEEPTHSNASNTLKALREEGET